MGVAATSADAPSAGISSGRQYDIVYVSPHLDDVAFSCATKIRRQLAEGLRVLVITIFTGGVGQGGGPLNSFASMDARIDEDKAAMALLGVDFLHAGFKEVIFRCGITTPGCVPARLALGVCSAWFCEPRANRELVRCVREYLEGVLAETACTWLVGPAGIGYHPDHLIVHRACRDIEPRTFGLRRWYYYDMPYCTYALLREPRLAFLRRRLPKQVGVETVSPVGDEIRHQEGAIMVYASQLEPCFGGKEKAERLLQAYPETRFIASEELPMTR